MSRQTTWRVSSLLYLLAAAILLPMTLLLAYQIHNQYTQGQRKAEAEALRLAELTADTAQTFIADARSVLKTLAQRPEMVAKAKGTSADCDPIFSSFKEFYPQLSNMSLSTPAGFLVCSSLVQPDNKPLPVADMAWYRQVYESQQFVVGPILYGPINKNWISVLAEPVRDASGVMVGALQTPIDLLKFRLVPAAEKLPPQILLLIVDSQGNILARSRDAARFVGTNVLGKSEIVTRAVADKRGTAESSGIEMVPRFYGFTPVEGTDWTAVAGIDADYALADARKNAVSSALIGGGLVFSVMGLAVFLSRRIAQPILVVSEAARQVGMGQLTLRVPIEGPLEVVEVAQQFNDMLDAIERSQAALQNSEQRLRMALDGSHMVMWDLELTTGTLYLSETWSELQGEPRAHTRLPLRDLLRQVPWSDRPKLRTALRAVMLLGRDGFEAEHRIINRKGQTLWMSTTGRVTERDGGGRASRLLGLLVDISERKHREADIYKLAYYDPLTGLPNRRLLQQQVAYEIARARRSGLTGALMFIDLDRFKGINDARGHAMGDVLLNSVAQRLESMMRECDMVARMGGDEFVVLVTGLHAKHEEAARLAHLLAEKIRAGLQQPYLIDTQIFISTASIGVVLVEPIERSCDDLLREADTAMYRAKSSGRNQIAFFRTEMQVEVENRLMMENDLAQAIDRNQLSLYVQPQFDGVGKTVGAELLLRWRHPILGAVSPAQFIPIAEDTGVILRIGDWVMEQACLLSTSLRVRGVDIPLSINVSPRQFRQPDFALHVQEKLLSLSTPPNSLIFEVTESLLLTNLENTLEQMHKLVGMGIRFSVDDFGTGYSSLSYLKRLPLYELKIDKSFVDGTPNELHDTQIVNVVLSLARMLELRVVAEGVETEAQAQYLRSQGCDVMQGYLFAKPMPIEAWLAEVM